MGALVLVFITPELYALYTQFDAHPEKVVFGRTGVSGIRFFFWDSQFGRFMNTGPIKGSGDPSFFFHTVLWAFLPWSVMLYAAVVQFIRKRKAAKEFYCISGALSTFLLFSLSKFQLPHYLNIIFPFFAILTAQYILTLNKPKFFNITQRVIMGLMAVAIAGLWALYQPKINYVFVGLIAAVVVLWFVVKVEKVFYRTCLISVILNLFLNGLFYPDVLGYQSGSSAAFYANEHLKGGAVCMYKENSYAFNFYLDAPVLRSDTLMPPPVLLYTTREAMDSLVIRGKDCEVLKSFPRFPVTKLDGEFVNFSTRKAAVGERLLVLVK